MATLPDVMIPTNIWESAFTISGIAPSTSIKIVNKSSSYLLVQITSSQPDASNNSGVYLSPAPDYTSSMNVTGESQVWLKAVSFPALANISEA